MPFVRYLVCVGGALLGLLFLADWYFPTSIDAATALADSIDRSTIRIHSSHKWPDAIQLDTAAPMPASPPVVATAALPSPPARHVRQAFAFEPQKAPEKVRRRARPARPAWRERSQRFANYQPPDSHGWRFAGW